MIEIIGLLILVVFSFFFVIYMMVQRIKDLQSETDFLYKQYSYYYNLYLVEFQKGIERGYNKDS